MHRRVENTLRDVDTPPAGAWLSCTPLFMILIIVAAQEQDEHELD